MPITVDFQESDLLVDITAKELDAIKTKAVGAFGDPNRVANTIAEQRQKVDDYTHRYNLDPERQKRLIRTLVIFELSTVLSDKIPEGRADKHALAMRELENIRDGKFDNLLPIIDPPPADLPPYRGRSGSNRKIQRRYC